MIDEIMAELEVQLRVWHADPGVRATFEGDLWAYLEASAQEVAP